ncbi:AraC family transcriptional regulator [Solimonas sp. K1W22B-7]|uniref:helix-turn-helix domain-containing protein n=1 Tax=Solimonas sp. K1W22B-7 TaxID=2303331 RepID=UPI000E32F8AE|nr:AraC family transcriptional regulator [Solimonas sp. K1W22B-7]AXQ27518.1 AraC family transcriptional regulator [Solimonas sp. K1W22B-7]
MSDRSMEGDALSAPADPREAAPRGHDVIGDGVCRPSNGLNRRALRRVHAYMLAHLGERIGLEDLARAACMSRFHFARQFRGSTACSPMEYLLYLRLETAAGLLAAGERPIGDIALAAGFCDQSHFCRTFRRCTGLTPKEYARRCADGLAVPPVQAPGIGSPSGISATVYQEAQADSIFDDELAVVA